VAGISNTSTATGYAEDSADAAEFWQNPPDRLCTARTACRCDGPTFDSSEGSFLITAFSTAAGAWFQISTNATLVLFFWPLWLLCRF
jgi:hypothetical protein